MPDAYDGHSAINRTLDHLLQLSEKVEQFDETAVVQMLKNKFMSMQPMVRRMLVRNYNASGLGDAKSSKDRGYRQTGDLKAFVLQSTVLLDGASLGDLRMKVRMPQSGTYHKKQWNKNQDTKNMHEISASINYGSLRKTKEHGKLFSGVGERAARSLKGYGFSGKLSQSQRGAIYSHHGIRGLSREPSKSGLSTKVTESTGGVAYAVAPVKFFYLSDAQWDELRSELLSAIEEM